MISTWNHPPIARAVPGPGLCSLGHRRRLSDRATAAILRGRLEAEGIPTLLDGERMGTAGMYLAATRGVRLQVPADKVAEARIILDQKWSLPEPDEKADFEDLL